LDRAESSGEKQGFIQFRFCTTILASAKPWS
jgi:hypothetical protein